MRKRLTRRTVSPACTNDVEVGNRLGFWIVQLLEISGGPASIVGPVVSGVFDGFIKNRNAANIATGTNVKIDIAR